MKKTIIMTLFGLAALPAAQAAAFANGSFESGITGWTIVGDVIISPGSYGANANDGTEWAQLGTNNQTNANIDSIAQIFDTMDGQAYEVTFDFAKYGLTAGDGVITVSVDNTAGTSAIYTDATGISATGANRAFAESYTDSSNKVFSFVASGASTTLTFRDTGTNSVGQDLALDNVRLAAVPEPSSSALLGLGGLALILRRRK